MKLGECTESDFEPYDLAKDAAALTPPTIVEKRETKKPAAEAPAKPRRVRVRSRHVRV